MNASQPTTAMPTTSTGTMGTSAQASQPSTSAPTLQQILSSGGASGLSPQMQAILNLYNMASAQQTQQQANQQGAQANVGQLYAGKGG